MEGVNVMVRERINLRQALLEDLYDYHFTSGGDAYLIEEFNEDGEQRLAYLYLSEKGYLDLFVDENGANANIIAAGIEIVEGGRITVH